MQPDRATLIETYVDRAASGLFALATGYAALTWLGRHAAEPLLGAEAACAAGIAYVLCVRTLGAVKLEPRKLPVPVFDVRHVNIPDFNELEADIAEFAVPEVDTDSSELPDFGTGEFRVRGIHSLGLEVAEASDELDELLLTDRVEPAFRPTDVLLLTYNVEPESEAPDEPLVLDDILTELGPDSRVVRLFDPSAMPTAGQLNDRIEAHLEREAPSPHDASQALHNALAELRRSLG